MKNFDQRWQRLASRARTASVPPETDVTAPHGFATRVLARAAEAGVSGPPLEELWLRCARQSVALMTAVGLVLGAMEVAASRPRELPHPGVENTVAQILWRL